MFLVRNHTLEEEMLAGLRQHYAVHLTQSRRAALTMLADRDVDLILVDLPSIRFDLDRFCAAVLKPWPDKSFFFLLSKGMRLDQLPHAQGYVRHPFTLAQLLRRLARTLPMAQGKIVAWHDLRLDVDQYFLMWDTRQIPMTPKQTALLEAFLRAPGTILTRAQLMQDVWGTDFIGDTRTLDVHVHWLRKSLAQLQAPFVILTERGKGYRFDAPPDRASQKGGLSGG